MNLSREGRFYSCCSDVMLLDWTKMELPELTINWSEYMLWRCAFTIVFAPVFWNFIARLEYNSCLLRRVFDSPKVACAMLATIIIPLVMFRNYSILWTIDSQPRCLLLQNNIILWTGHFLTVVGCLLVLTSFWKLGFYGTFLGDYFGIVKTARVKSFPYSIMNHPMYCGTTLNFLGSSFLKASQAGILLTILLGFMFAVIAIWYEGPFTAFVYSQTKKKK